MLQMPRTHRWRDPNAKRVAVASQPPLLLGRRQGELRALTLTLRRLRATRGAGASPEQRGGTKLEGVGTSPQALGRVSPTSPTSCEEPAHTRSLGRGAKRGASLLHAQANVGNSDERSNLGCTSRPGHLLAA